MIQFSKDNNGRESFTIRFDGCREEYISIVKSMLFFMGNCQYNGEINQETYNMCRLIDSMLPDANQIITKEDIEILKQAKKGGLNGKV